MKRCDDVLYGWIGFFDQIINHLLRIKNTQMFGMRILSLQIDLNVLWKLINTLQKLLRLMRIIGNTNAFISFEHLLTHQWLLKRLRKVLKCWQEVGLNVLIFFFFLRLPLSWYSSVNLKWCRVGGASWAPWHSLYMRLETGTLQQMMHSAMKLLNNFFFKKVKNQYKCWRKVNYSSHDAIHQQISSHGSKELLTSKQSLMVRIMILEENT